MSEGLVDILSSLENISIADEDFSSLLNDIDFNFMFSQLESLTSKAIPEIPKFFDSFLNHALPDVVDPDFKSRYRKHILERIYPSGSIIEGCAFSRLLSPNLPSNHVEIECDFIEIFGEISKDKAGDLIKDLPYARGFAWIKYDSEITELENCCSEVEGTCFFRASAFRKHIADTSSSYLEDGTASLSSSTIFHINQYEAGPSAAIDMTANTKSLLTQIPKKEDMKNGLVALSNIIQCLRDSFVLLVPLYRDYKSAEEQLYHYLLTKLSSANALTKSEIHSLFSDGAADTCHVETSRKDKNDVADNDSFKARYKGNAMEHRSEMEISKINVTKAHEPETCTADVSTLCDPETSQTSPNTVYEPGAFKEGPNTPNEPETYKAGLNQTSKLETSKEDPNTAHEPEAPTGGDVGINTTEKPATRPKDKANITKKEGSQKSKNHERNVSVAHPGCIWNRRLNKLADSVHRVLIEIDQQIINSKVKELLGYQRLHFVPILEELTKLQKEFIMIHLSLGCIEKNLLQLYAENPDFVVQFLLTTCVRAPGQDVDFYSIALGIMQQSLRILPPRLFVMDAACYSYDQIYQELSDAGEPVKSINEFKEMLDGIITSMDRVPAFRVKQWPSVARSWSTRFRSWPGADIIDTIVDGGCHIVPKPYKGEKGNEELDWRWSFSMPEIIIAKARTEKMTMCYFLLKCMFYKYFKALTVNDITLSSYLMKTVMLFESEMHEKTWWEEHSMLFCLDTLVRRFNTAMSEGFLSHYFVSDLNLLDGLPEELLLQANAVAESILCDIRVPTTEILFKIKDVHCLFVKDKEREGTDVATNSQPAFEKGACKPDNTSNCRAENSDGKDTLSVGSGAEKTDARERIDGAEEIGPLYLDAGQVTINEFSDIENMPLVIAKMRKCFEFKQVAFQGIEKKQGLIVLMERVIKGVEQLYPQAADIASTMTVELDENNNFGFQVPMNWSVHFHQIPSLSVSFSCSEAVRFEMNLF